jgi:hypothetical protein
VSLNGAFTIPAEPPRTNLSPRRDLYPGLWRSERAEIVPLRALATPATRRAVDADLDPELEAGALADLARWGCNPFEED